MKRYIALVLLLFFVSSCSLLSVDFFSLDDKGNDEGNTTMNPLWQHGERKDYGPVTAADFQTYVNFHIRLSCGESIDNLLTEYDIDVNRLVEIGRKYGNETLKHSVFQGVMSSCPEKIDVLEPSIGKSE